MRKNLGAVLFAALVVGLAGPAFVAPAGAVTDAGLTGTVPSSRAETCTIKGTKRDDVLVGTKRADVMCGRGGNDVLRGGKGNDVLRGEGGRDTLVGEGGDDTLDGGPGGDRLRAAGDGAFRDVLICGGGTDRADADADDEVMPGCEKLNQPTPLNNAPSGADRTLTLAEDGSHTFARSDFGFSDPDSHGLLEVQLVSVPATGVLELSGAAVAAGQVVPAGSISSLAFQPGADANGSPFASFTFAVRDDGGTGGGGSDTDPTPDTITIDVTPVNDAPTFVKGPDQNGIANSGADNQPKAYTVNPWASAISAGPGESGQTVTFEVTNDDATLFQVQPAVSPTGVLTFTPAVDAIGTANVTVQAIDDGGTAGGGDDTSQQQTFTITTVEPAETGPAITSVSPSPLVPGSSATLTGQEFDPTVAGNTVTIGGAAATVTAATATTLTVTVPCVLSGNGVPVQATVGGTPTNVVNHPVQGTKHDLDVGEASIIDQASKVGCTEITSAGGPARYVIAAYNTSTSPGSASGIRLSGDPAGDDSPVPFLDRGPVTLTEPAFWSDLLDGETGHEHLENPEGDHDHLDLLRRNREQYRLLREEFGTEGVQRSGVRADTTAADMPLTKTFRVGNIFAGNFCNSYYVASATRVYAEGKLVIYEDDATPTAFKAASNPSMADYYDKIGDQFNADMEPIVRNNFGDILRRDAVTDNNGVMVAFSTPLLNNSFPGVAGFVVSCDQFPNDDTTGLRPVGGPYTGSGINGSSNFGEYFYLYQPTINGTGYTNGTPDEWYRTVRATFIHESKHVASQAARVANNAGNFEVAWLEEGTARHAEELWARQSIYGVPWKGNTGYGSAAAPNSIYCDLRPNTAACTSSNPRRPSLNMFRHFSAINTYLSSTNSTILSPFGPTPFDNGAYWYATSWSLVRYAIDRYGTSDAAFLSALTQSTSTGVTNLSQRSTVPIEALLGRWALALAVDDYPGLTGASPDIQMPTWNFRDIYAGIQQDFATQFSYPSQPESYTFGSLAPGDVSAIYGGGVKLFQLSGTQTQAQLLRLQGSGGGALPSGIRIAVVRVQ